MQDIIKKIEDMGLNWLVHRRAPGDYFANVTDPSVYKHSRGKVGDFVAGAFYGEGEDPEVALENAYRLAMSGESGSHLI